MGFLLVIPNLVPQWIKVWFWQCYNTNLAAPLTAPTKIISREWRYDWEKNTSLGKMLSPQYVLPNTNLISTYCNIYTIILTKKKNKTIMQGGIALKPSDNLKNILSGAAADLPLHNGKLPWIFLAWP